MIHYFDLRMGTMVTSLVVQGLGVQLSVQGV